MVRLRHFVFGAVCMFACSHAADRLRSRSAPLVVLEGNGAFGSVPITTASPPRTFEVKPAPPADSLQFDIIESIESTCPEFEVSAPGAAGAIVRRICTMFGGTGYGGDGETFCTAFEEQTFTFTVTFKPVLELPSSDQCRIIVRLDGGSSKSITVSGTGAPPPKRALFSTKSDINFNTVNQGTTSTPSEITVKNTGSGPLQIGASITGAAGVITLTGNQTLHSISPGVTELYSVACSPPTTDPDPTPYAATLTITTDDPDAADAMVVYDVACIGIDHPLNPSITTLVQTRVEESIPITVNLSNISGATANFTSITLEEPAAPGLTITSAPTGPLPSGQVRAIELAWDPPAAFAGDLGALIVAVQGEADRKVSVVNLGIARLADVASNVPAGEQLDFGKLCIGESKTRPVAMQPAGNDIMALTGYRVTGATSMSPFSAAITGPDTVEVDPPTEVTIDVTTMPMITDGKLEGTLTVTTDSPTEPTYDIPLAVEVLQAGATVSPPLLDFREVVVTGFSETKTAVFRNCTAEAVEITGITLDGDSSLDFDIIQIMPDGVEQLPPFSLPRNGEVLIAVQMLPQTSGSKAAQVSIDFQEPGKAETSNETIALIGEGFFGAPDRDSYYRCSAGSPIHALPLLFVGVFVVVRRRRR